VNISVFDDQSALAVSLDAAKAIIKAVLQEEHQPCDEVSLYFVTTEEICSLHKQYFNDPSPTDCISFPIDEDPTAHYRVLGDVFVCPETAINYAALHNTDPYEEVTLYIIHGLLHLIGYDDMSDEDAAIMRQAESHHMARVIGLCR
jgi:probable rRNA maturation factor